MDSSPFQEQPVDLTGDAPGSPTPALRNKSPATPSAKRSTVIDLGSSSPATFSPVKLPRPAQPAAAPPRAPAPPSATAGDATNETLRAEVNSLRYELDVIREERELEKLQAEEEKRALEAVIEDHQKKVDAVETDKRFLFEKQQELSTQIQKIKDTTSRKTADLERTIRRLKSENSELKDLVNDNNDMREQENREHRRKHNEAETRIRTLTQTVEELREMVETKNKALEETQEKVNEKDKTMQELETELLKAKTSSGDAETLKVLKKELSEQVSHIKSLESTNRRYSAELKTLRETVKSIEVLEEEKRGLEAKVSVVDELREKLGEAEVQVAVLRDEKNRWQSYFEAENLEFHTPEQLAKALLEARVEIASLLEKSGRMAPDVEEKVRLVQELEVANDALKKELEDAKGAVNKDLKARQRLERQKALATKEAQFLREQLKSFSTEETLNMSGNYDEQKNQRIEQLEALLESYKQEIEQLTKEAQSSESGAVPASAGTKRPREDGEDERLGELIRKNRQLQEEIAELQKANMLSQKELEALHRRLESMEGTSVRILQLKDNPTSREQAVKVAQLTALREENRALLAQVEGRKEDIGRVVPWSTLENAREQIKEMEKVVQEKEKRMMRLKQIWSAKSLEFREAVYSLLGWKIDFMPNGRVRVAHMFAGNDQEQTIEFDGEAGTMKLGGGPDSMWSKEIRHQCQFWMQRNSIPCLLASVLIEQFEKTTRAQV